MCDLKDLNFRTIRKYDEPFVNYEIKNYIPKRRLFENKHFNNCAIISSAGALKGSNLGKLIGNLLKLFLLFVEDQIEFFFFLDSHDLVLRFNHAPSVGYEKDVGSKTTIRVLNSQVVSKEEFNFISSNLYKNITLVAWDPSNYTSTLDEWYHNPDFNFFDKYIQHRKINKSKFYLLNPRSLWSTWDFLQGNSPNRIRRNPPSSGFLGKQQTSNLFITKINFSELFRISTTIAPLRLRGFLRIRTICTSNV